VTEKEVGGRGGTSGHQRVRTSPAVVAPAEGRRGLGTAVRRQVYVHSLASEPGKTSNQQFRNSRAQYEVDGDPKTDGAGKARVWNAHGPHIVEKGKLPVAICGRRFDEMIERHSRGHGYPQEQRRLTVVSESASAEREQR
jgi:hypothetical protein